MKGMDIKRLLPQRDPILMVDELLEAEDDAVHTCFSVRSGNLFLDEGGALEETGLMEHMAQSASVLAGYRAACAGATEPPVGYIGEVKDFACHRRPLTGDRLHTIIRVEAEAEGVMRVSGVTRVQTEVVAETQMKLFVLPHG